MKCLLEYLSSWRDALVFETLAMQALGSQFKFSESTETPNMPVILTLFWEDERQTKEILRSLQTS